MYPSIASAHMVEMERLKDLGRQAAHHSLVLSTEVKSGDSNGKSGGRRRFGWLVDMFHAHPNELSCVIMGR